MSDNILGSIIIIGTFLIVYYVYVLGILIGEDGFDSRKDFFKSLIPFYILIAAIAEAIRDLD